MPKFSDIFFAKLTAEAIHYNIFSPNYPHITVPDLTDYEISALWACLTHSKLKSQHNLEFIEIDSDALLYRFPNALTELLTQLNNQQISSIASIWCELEDFPWQKAQAAEKIIAIRDLAKQAEKEQASLFLILS